MKATISAAQTNMERERMRLSFVSSLKDCAKKKDLDQGSRIHADIRNSGLLEKNTYLGNTLVSMYAKCGSLVRAQQVVDELPVRDVISWNTLITGYSKQGQSQKALGCFQRMQSEGHSPTAITYACILKACGTTKNIIMGKRIHDEIASQGLLKKDVVLGNALVNMYAKCGVLVKAQKVLDELPVRNVVSWSALITGYVQQGQGLEALGCFQRMRREGIYPDAITYACILKACSITQDVAMGKKIYDDIVSQGLLKTSVVLGTALIDMYVQQGQGQEALGCFQWMQSEGLAPDAITYVCILKACGITQNADMGKQIHDDIVRQGLLEKHVVLGNALVDMYAKCGVLEKARKVLDELLVRDVVSWNTLITGYVQQGQGQEAFGCFQGMQKEGTSPDVITYACILKACGITQDADMGKKIYDDIVSQGLLKNNVVLGTALVDMYVQQGQGQEAVDCFERMRSEGLSPDAITYACILKACGIARDADMGQKFHNDIVNQGLLEKNVLLGNALVDMYAKCGILVKAQKVLDELSVRNVVSWTALIAGYVQQGQGQEALGCFRRMRSEGISPSAITYACILKACGIMQDVVMSKRIHDNIVSQGLLKQNIVLSTALIDMYVQQGQGQEALGCFQQMRSEGISPDAITYACILKACGIMQDIDTGKKVHDDIVSQGLLKKNVVLSNALVDMYAKCGVLQKAQKVLDELTVRDVGSWNALIAGYGEQGQGEEALGCFQRMRSEGVSPDEITYAYILKAMLTS